MEILYGPDFKISEDTVVTIGKFDGVHCGHKKVLEEVVKEASKSKLKSVVYTFLKNPKLFLHQAEFTPLMTNEEKASVIGEFLIDYLIYEDFNQFFSEMNPEEFVKEVLIEKLRVKVVVMGKNSTFGKDRTGNIETMIRLGEKFGFKVICVNMILNNGEIISSSKIRENKLLQKY